MDLKLTQNERDAKIFFMRIIKEGSLQNIDSDDCDYTKEASVPAWYDNIKFKRGQKYFHDNRFGIMEVGFSGLYSLLADPKALEILMATGRSSEAKTAKKRYISTACMSLLWYDSAELAPETKFWQSLKRTRRLHLLASKLAHSKNIQQISQFELSLTAFGFMGYALARPHYFGIKHDCAEDQDAFIHFWAIICHMIGIEDRFNMCLHPLPVVELINLLVMQYFFTPFLHFETPQFRQMVLAVLDGMSDILPNMTYDVQMFRVRRAAGVTGYQYNTNAKKDKLCRLIFDEDELEVISKFAINRFGYDYSKLAVTSDTILSTTSQAIALIANEHTAADNIVNVKKSNTANELKLLYQNDSKFKELRLFDKLRVHTIFFISRFYQSFIGWHIMEMVLTTKLNVMRRFLQQARSNKK